MNKLTSIVWSDPPIATFVFEWGGKQRTAVAATAWTKPPEWAAALKTAEPKIKQRAANALYREHNA